MDDMASVGLKVDSTDVRAASGDLDKFAGAGDRAGGSAGRAQGAFAGMGKSLAVAAASALAAVVSIAALSSQLNSFIDATVTNEKAQAQLGAAIASTGGAAGKSVADLNAHAAALQKVTNFGDEAINAMQGVLLTFREIKGDEFDAATLSVLDMSQALGKDLQSSAQQVGKALNDPVKGMTALSLSGVTFTDVQMKMAKEMVAANNIVGAQAIILKELEANFGGSAKAARDTLGGALASLRNAFGDLFELSGPGSENLRASIERLTAAVANSKFFDAVQSIGTALFAAAEVGIGALTGLTDAFVFLFDNAYILGAAIVVLASTQIPAMVAATFTASAGMSFMTAQFIAGAIAARAMTVAAGIARAALALLGGPIGIAVGAVTALGLALISIKPHSAKLKLDAEATAKAYAEAAGSAALFNQSSQSTAEASAEIKEYLDGVTVASGGLTAEMIRQYVYAALSRAESDASLATGQEILANLQQQNEIARLELAYGADSVQVAEARQRAELAVLDAQLQSLDVSQSLKLEILAAAQAGFDLENSASGASGNINSAANEAARLEGNLAAAANAISAVMGATANLNISAIGLEVQNRALEAGNSLIQARTEGLIATKQAELANALGSGDAAIRAAAAVELAKYTDAVNRNSNAQEINQKLTKALTASTAAVGGASGKAAGKIKELAIETTEAEKAVKAYADAIEGMVVSGIGRAVDWMVDGFKGGFNGLLNIAKDTLKQIIAFYLKNKIVLSLGIGGGVGGGATQALAGAAGGGGPLGTLGSLGSSGGMLGGVLGTIGANFGAGFMTSVYGGLGGLTGAVSGGLSVGGLAGISTAIGAIAAPLLAVVAVFSFFKKTTKELDAGLKVTVDGMDALVQTFSVIETKRFWGLSKKVSTSFENASDEIANPLIKAVGEMQGGIVNSAEALGISAAVFDGFAHTLQVSTKGLSDEAAQKAVMDAFEGLGDAFAGMIPGLQALQKDGEGAMAAISRLAQSLAAVNGWMGNFRMNLYDVSLAGAVAASAFVDLFGSMENFNAVSQSYYANFFTDAERIARATELLSIEMLALGIDTLPSTRAAFRALVDEADALGDSGLVASLMQLSPVFAEISAGADALGDSLRALVNEDLFATGQDYMRALSRTSNGQLFTPQQSDAELRAELRALNVSMERLVSSSEITAGNTGRGADAADDTLAFQLEQTL